MERETIELFNGTSWDEINRPHHKQPILEAFPGKYSCRKVYPQNLQGSGISEHFKSLLNTPLNRYGYKSIVGVFNDIDRGYRVEI